VTPSQTLQFSEVQEALHCAAALDELMNFIVYITHPAQYEASVQGMAHVKAKEGNVIKESLSWWASIFTGRPGSSTRRHRHIVIQVVSQLALII
jgi:hypothetical protein